MGFSFVAEYMKKNFVSQGDFGRRIWVLLPIIAPSQDENPIKVKT